MRRDPITCCYCGEAFAPPKMRPYGPGGAWTCHPCATGDRVAVGDRGHRPVAGLEGVLVVTGAVEKVRLWHGDPGPHAVGAARVTALPPFLRPRSPGGYTHRPRSAHWYSDGRICVQSWCGQLRHVRHLVEFTDQAPKERLCATCDGRFRGVNPKTGLVFTPRDVFAPPKWCPNTEDTDPSGRFCPVCGAVMRVSPTRYGYSSRAYAKHRPGPDLPPAPCSVHGWSRVGGDLRCWPTDHCANARRAEP